MLPVVLVAWGVSEALDLADGLGKKFGVVLAIYYPIAEVILLQERRSERVIAETTAAFPAG